MLNDVLCRREDNDDDTNDDDDDRNGDDGRYEFRLFAAMTNFHENSRAVLLFLLSMKLVALDVPLYPRVLR